MENFKNIFSRIGKKEAIALLILLIALPVSVFLVQKNQELRERAGGGAIFFRDKDGGPLERQDDGTAISNSLEVQVELNAPAP